LALTVVENEREELENQNYDLGFEHEFAFDKS